MRLRLKDIGTEQVPKNLSTRTEMELCCKKDKGVYHMMCRLLGYFQVSVGYLLWARYIQKILGALPRKFPFGTSNFASKCL